MKNSGRLLGPLLAVFALAGLIAVNARAAAAAAPNEKDVYVKRIEARLQYLQTKITVLQSKISKVQEKTKAELEAKLDILKTNKEKADKELAKLKKAGDQNWKEYQAKVREEVKEANKAYRNLIASSKLFLQEQKEQYERDTEITLKVFDNKIAKLDAQIVEIKNERKKELKADMSELRTKRDVVRKKLDGLKAAGTDKWEAMKPDLDKARQELSKSYDEILAKLK